MNNRAFTSLSFKLIGVVLLLSSLLDYITLAIPLNLQSSQWQIGLLTNIVDRGIVPLVGIGFILLGYFVENLNDTTLRQSSEFDLRVPIYILSSIMGLMFLLIIPLHLNNLNEVKVNTLNQIEQGAGQGADQIQAFLAQIDQLSKNPQRLSQQIQQLNQAVESGEVQGQSLNAQQLEQLQKQRTQLEQLQDLSKNPTEYKNRIDELTEQFQEQLISQRRQAENKAKTQALKQSLRIGLSSLMLAIVYSTVGWIGFKVVMGSKTS
ncbi:HpsJ family protein [Cyanobacterium sp. uoEpiScrs1]|uniref:hormogonium polysaccharide biosynthesis protein HpsJ n=1 Tax=Cyanobacterium sp. uoEpiScrs1 TaxID=2976343 RepID=UPI00226AE05B|nr:HpsJ family protein [Cyanobacterium sp. uoEpiScrs1]